MSRSGEPSSYKCQDEEPTRPAKPAAHKSLRYGIMMLAMLGPFVVTYSKTIINYAITDMIDPRSLIKRPPELGPQSMALNATANSAETFFELDNSCPVDEATRIRLIDENERDIGRAVSIAGDKFDWDKFQQGLLKGAYYYGSVPLQVPGSRLSEMYGSHPVMSICSLMIGLGCLLAPTLASMGCYVLFADLLFMGMMGSFMAPALITLFANWLTPGEKSIVISTYHIACGLGYALSSWLPFTIINARLSWHYIFYSAGGIGLIFSLLFFLCARSNPIDHPFISTTELAYLEFKNTLVREAAMKRRENIEKARELANLNEGQPSTNSETVPTKGIERKEKKPPAPWLAILTSMPVWAFIVARFSVKFASDAIAMEMPTYLKTVMHFDTQTNKWINTYSNIVYCLGCFMVGVLAKIAVKRRPFGASKTAIRKAFQGIASFGGSLLLLGFANSVCDETSSVLILMILFCITTFCTGGEAQIPVEISERYSGTIHAIGTSLALSSAIEPTLVGYFLQDHGADRERWQSVWICASAVMLFGGIFFILFGDANLQSFDSIDTSKVKNRQHDIESSHIQTDTNQ